MVKLKAVYLEDPPPSAPPAPETPPHRRHPHPRQHPSETKALALAAASCSSSDDASTISGVPARTIRGWVAEFELMGSSELDALITAKKRLMSGLWAVLGIDALEFAQELRASGNAKGFLAAMTAAGICDTKLTGNQPDRGRFGAARQVEGVVSASTPTPSTLLDRLNTPPAPAEPDPAPADG